MNLAQLIHKSLTNPQFRLALETGTLNLDGSGLSSHEISAAAEVMRHNRMQAGESCDKPFSLSFADPSSIGWRKAV